MESSNGTTPVVLNHVSNASFFKELDDSDSELEQETPTGDPYFVAEMDEEHVPVDDTDNVCWALTQECLSNDTWSVPESEGELSERDGSLGFATTVFRHEEVVPFPVDDDNATWTTMSIRRLLEDQRSIPQADDEGSNASEHGDDAFNRFLADGFGPRLFDFAYEDQHGNVPLRLVNKSDFFALAIGFIFTTEDPPRTTYRFFGVLDGHSEDVLAKVDEDFIFCVFPSFHVQHDRQLLGFCTEANGSPLEYYFQAGTASEIIICNTIQGVQSLKDVCAGSVLAHAGKSQAALNQLPLPDSLKEYLIDKTDATSRDRAQKLLDRYYARNEWLDAIIG